MVTKLQWGGVGVGEANGNTITSLDKICKHKQNPKHLIG
jgi:hypothetical protein